MIEIRNLLFQPLTFQLAGEGRGLHLSSRQRKLIEDAQVSEEMRTAEKGGFIVLTPLEQPDQPEAQPVATEPVDTPVGTAVPPNAEPGADAQTSADSTPAVEDGGSSAEPESSEQPTETTTETISKKRR